MTAAEVADQLNTLAQQGWIINVRAVQTGWLAQAVNAAGNQSYTASGVDFKTMGADLLGKIAQ